MQSQKDIIREEDGSSPKSLPTGFNYRHRNSSPEVRPLPASQMNSSMNMTSKGRVRNTGRGSGLGRSSSMRVRPSRSRPDQKGNTITDEDEFFAASMELSMRPRSWTWSNGIPGKGRPVFRPPVVEEPKAQPSPKIVKPRPQPQPQMQTQSFPQVPKHRRPVRRQGSLRKKLEDLNKLLDETLSTK